MLDGALATELERQGADLNDPLWSARCLIESPALISQVHMDYLQAGADVITSATYQASVKGFQDRGLDEQQAIAMLQLGISLACAARDDFWSSAENRPGRLKPLVAASVGPFGACLHDGSEYHGNYAAGWAQVESFHRSRLDILAACGADILAFETIPSLREAEILLDLLSRYQGQYAWLSFSCRDETHVSHGERLSEGADLASRHPQVAAVGINCTAPRFVTALLESVNVLECPLLAYPNSGETWRASDNQWVGQGSDTVDYAAWFHAGARLIGGCCRTGPEDIARVRSTLKSVTARMSQRIEARGQGKSTLVWRLLTVAVVVFFLAAGVYFLFASTRESKRLEQALLDRYGWASQYTPAADGTVPPQRLEKFIHVRRALQPNCSDYQNILDGITGLAAIETDSGLSGREKASRGISGFRSVIMLTPKMLAFMEARNANLLAEEMGLGEYMYIYLTAYGTRLAGEPSSRYAGMEEAYISARTRAEFVQILGNQLKALQASGEENGPGGLSADLRTEIAALEDGSHIAPWPGGPPGMTRDSLASFHERLLDLYCAGIVAIELQQKNRGLDFAN